MLIDYLTGTLSYDPSWAIYAKRINGKFEPESPARFGQRILENGGLLDDCEYFANNESICNARAAYCGLDDDAADFYEEWATEYVEQMNLVRA